MLPDHLRQQLRDTEDAIDRLAVVDPMAAVHHRIAVQQALVAWEAARRATEPLRDAIFLRSLGIEGRI
jgi:hypothetical protein